MRWCIAASFSFASVVTMVQVRNTLPSGARQPSHSPASAIGAPSASATAKGCLDLPSVRHS